MVSITCRILNKENYCCRQLISFRQHHDIDQEIFTQPIDRGIISLSKAQDNCAGGCVDGAEDR